MNKRYLWLVHDYMAHDVEILESDIKSISIPIHYFELNKRYQLFVISKDDIQVFVQKIKNILPCECKAYEFSEDDMLIGEHYIDPKRSINVFVPWIDAKSLTTPESKEYSYFFFADFNATFEVTDRLLEKYLHHCDCKFNVLGCVKTEPAFYTSDSYYASRLKVQMHYGDVLLVMGLLFKMVVENHRFEDEGSMTLLYGEFGDDRVRLFDRWCIANIWTLSHDASFGHEMPLYCQWEFEQAIRKGTET